MAIVVVEQSLYNPHADDVVAAKIVLTRIEDDIYSVQKDLTFAIAKVDHEDMGVSTLWGEMVRLSEDSISELRAIVG